MSSTGPWQRQRLTRRQFGGLAAAAATATVATAPTSVAQPQAPSDQVLTWINRHAAPLRSTGATGPLDDLRPLRRIVGDGYIVGLGYPVQGTHTLITTAHRTIRFLVEHMGFRTIGWEESWGSGAVIDRYVVGGQADALDVVLQTHIMLHCEEFLELVRWMREFNQGRPDHDKVRFLGMDSAELRAFTFDEILGYVTDVAPERVAELRELLDPLRMRGEPQEHLRWYMGDTLTEDDRQRMIAGARALYDLVQRVPAGPSTIERDEAIQHAQAILGFYHMYSVEGRASDARDYYMSEHVDSWRRRTGHRIVYCSHSVHAAGSPSLLVTVPGEGTVEHRCAGGRLRQRHGRRFVSMSMVFNEGQVLAGWERHDIGPTVFTVPPPHSSFVDNVLGQADAQDYLLDLRRGVPPAVTRWLNDPAKLRLIFSTYFPEHDADHASTIDSWNAGYDAVLHVNHVDTIRRLD